MPLTETIFRSNEQLISQWEAPETSRHKTRWHFYLSRHFTSINGVCGGLGSHLGVLDAVGVGALAEAAAAVAGGAGVASVARASATARDWKVSSFEYLMDVWIVVDCRIEFLYSEKASHLIFSYLINEKTLMILWMMMLCSMFLLLWVIDTQYLMAGWYVIDRHCWANNEHSTALFDNYRTEKYITFFLWITEFNSTIYVYLWYICRRDPLNLWLISEKPRNYCRLCNLYCVFTVQQSVLKKWTSIEHETLLYLWNDMLFYICNH